MSEVKPKTDKEGESYMSSHDISSTSSPYASKMNEQNDKQKLQTEQLSSYIDNSLEPISNNSEGEEDDDEVE